jgi:hypothetical protein
VSFIIGAARQRRATLAAMTSLRRSETDYKPLAPGEATELPGHEASRKARIAGRSSTVTSVTPLRLDLTDEKQLARAGKTRSLAALSFA